MTKFIELLISGIGLGFIYALIALGFVVIFKSTEVISFVHGSILLLGGYLMARLAGSLAFVPALLVSVAATALLALLIERAFIRPLRRKAADAVAPTILTIGVDIVVLTDLTRRIGAHVFAVPNPWGSGVLHLGGYGIPTARVAAIITALVLIAAFLLAFKFTTWGVAMRASSEDGEAAALMGIRRGWVAISAWVIAGILATVAGVFLTAFPSPGLTNTTGLAALRAFPAAVLGGLDSITGVLAGGLVIGLAETYVSGYANEIEVLGRGIGSITPWIVMLIVLLIRPSGLFGTREATRV